MDRAISKVRGTSRRSSVDDRGNSDEGRRLSTFVAKTKRKIRSSRGDDVERSSSTDGAAATYELDHSDSSLLLSGSGRSSLFTDDERVDCDNNPVRPSLSTRSSHAGYLTYSSPVINEHATPVITNSDTAQPESPAEPLANIPHIIEPSVTTATLPAPAPPERSPSPASRFRGKLSRKKSGDTDSMKSAGGGSGGLGGLFKASSRRNSISDQPKAEEPPQSVPPQDSVPSVASQHRPQTPQHKARPLDTTVPATPPNLLDTPTTLVTPPTPTDPTSASASATFRPVSPTKGSPATRALSSVESIRHRRAQSANLPSKLSTTTIAPLTPTLEESKTPGGTLTQGSQGDGASGFFSSFFSATTKAAGSVGSGINILPFQKGKASSTPQLIDAAAGGEEVIPGPESRPSTGPAQGSRTPLAIETIGRGDLSFSHLGISESAPDLMASAIEPPAQAHFDGPSQNGDRGRKAEEEAAARAVSSAYEKAPSETATVINGSNRPLSVASNERLTLGEQTPPRAGTGADGGNVKRSGSVRSKLSGRRKHRGSSATAGTSNSIAAALKDSTSGLAQPGVHGAGHRLTGFAVASNKRNKDFHNQFRSVPEDDYLIEDYSAALQRDILLHGRLYVSEGHVCFSSNILGWVTNLVISFDEVISIEKKSTAMIFPNALIISTLQARNTFASFVARDSTYELLIGIWKISHPNLKSSLNGVVLDNAGTGDKTEVADAPEGDGATTDGSEDEVYDEDADDDEDDAGSFTDGGMGASDAGSNIGDTTLSRKTSAIPVAIAPQTNGNATKSPDGVDTAVVGAATSSEFPGPPAHEPTECNESSEHYDRALTDTTIPAPLGQVYSLMFGPASGAFMKKWLVDDQKSRELNYADDKTGLDNDHKTFTFDYIKPLYNPVGPKQTKCTTTNTLKAFALDKAVSVECSTVTPDVPSGSSFTTKTRYCLMWGPNNSTRLIASFTLEWTAKSWLKGAIESGALSGQTEYVKAIVAALKAAVTTKPPVKGAPRKGKRKGGRKEVCDVNGTVARGEPAASTADASPNWGVFEPVRPVFEPFVALLRPFVNSQVVIAVLFVLLAYSWLFPSRGGNGIGRAGYTPPERVAAYEEIWRREESALWDWLEDRVGLEGVHAPPIQKQDRQKVMTASSLSRDLDEQRMSDRQMDAAIKSTEQKLAALKEAVDKRKTKRAPKS
ncbi:putative membrane-anchored lipid-binding protein Ysp2/Lam4 [Septoria linicola]|nr:putative membrane-anchored lipid-binding protein Ysp2/Lam4 [Septoria linicola]